MRNLRNAVLVPFVLLTSACAGGPETILPTVSDALAAPSGAVDLRSARDVLKLVAPVSRAVEVARSAIEFGALEPTECRSDDTRGRVDLHCVLGEWPGSGTVEYEVSKSEGVTTVYATLHRVCTAWGCIDGVAALRRTQNDDTADDVVAVDVDLLDDDTPSGVTPSWTPEAGSVHVFGGLDASVKSGPGKTEFGRRVIVFGDDGSWVVDVVSDQTGDHQDVHGANASVRCDDATCALI
ncbi:MAG: hypothetical protein U0414_42895 [Polyangiaceae bacterium]